MLWNLDEAKVEEIVRILLEKDRGERLPGVAPEMHQLWLEEDVAATLNNPQQTENLCTKAMMELGKRASEIAASHGAKPITNLGSTVEKWLETGSFEITLHENTSASPLIKRSCNESWQEMLAINAQKGSWR